MLLIRYCSSCLAVFRTPRGLKARVPLRDQTATHPSQSARRMGHPLRGCARGRLGHPPENLRRKLLIARAGFGAEQWMQGVRLWKECLLSRGSDDYESRLDRRVMYFLRCRPAERPGGSVLS